MWHCGIKTPPYVANEGQVKAWTDLEKESARSAPSYFDTLAKMFIEIGCGAEGGPYVAGGLTQRLTNRFGGISLEAEVAAAFLDDARCPGARGLSDENEAKPNAIRDRGFPKSH